MDLIRAIHREEGATIILVTHDEATAARVAERVLRIHDGRLERTSEALL